jgi:hypothetical protein
MLVSGIVSNDLTSNVLTPLCALICRQSFVWIGGLALIFSEGVGLSIVIILIIVLVDIDQLFEIDLVS